MTGNPNAKPKKYKKKERKAVITNSPEEVKQILINFMVEFLCDQISSGELSFNEQSNDK